MDYSSSPATISTDAAAINATIEVLELAKEGLIDYQELVSNSGGMFMNESAMYDSMLMPNDWRFQNRGMEGEGQPIYRVAMFPGGSSFTPVSYQLAVAFISAQSPAADACYRWLSFLAERPEVLGGMPARRSAFEASLEFITDGEDVVQLYRDFDAALSSGNAMILPQAYGDSTDNVAVSMNNYLTTLWLYKAFDNYVLHDGDLEADLLQAQTYLTEFASCSSGFPQRTYAEFGEENQEEYEAYYFQFVECAVAVDPDLQPQFQYIYDQMEDSEEE